MSGRSRRLMVVLAASLALAVAGGIGLQAFETQVTSSQGPTGYRGIVAANFNGADAGEEIVGDFGTLGVWLCHHWNQWVKITSDNPEWMFAVKFANAADSELVGDFGTKGLWVWDVAGNYTGTWTQLTTSNAENAIAVDDDWDGNEELEVDFGTLGLWRYDFDTKAWNLLTPSNPVGAGLRTDFWDVGWQEGLWSFGDLGLWSVFWDNGTYVTGAYWQQITSSHADDWAAANFVDASGTDTREELIVDFDGLGTWLFNSSRVWVKLTDSMAQAVVPVKFGEGIVDAELIFADALRSPWCWWGGSTWERLSYTPLDLGFVVPYDSDFHASGEPASEQELLGDFGTQGLWEFNYVAGGSFAVWRQLSTSNPVFMVAADVWGDGVQGETVVYFGPGLGLWVWDSGIGAFASKWTKLTDSAPDSTLSW